MGKKQEESELREEWKKAESEKYRLQAELDEQEIVRAKGIQTQRVEDEFKRFKSLVIGSVEDLGGRNG